MKKINLIHLILAGLFAALTAIGAFIRIPLPYVPLTLQVFFCLLAGLVLGARVGLLSQVTYIVVGLVGLPVFTSGGGPGYVLHPTFGYLAGLIVCAFAVGKLAERQEKITIARLFLINIIGVLIIYAVGVPYLYLIKNLYLGTEAPLSKVIYGGFLLTVPGDIIKSYLAALIGVKLIPYVKNMLTK